MSIGGLLVRDVGDEVVVDEDTQLIGCVIEDVGQPYSRSPYPAPDEAGNDPLLSYQQQSSQSNELSVVYSTVSSLLLHNAVEAVPGVACRL